MNMWARDALFAVVCLAGMGALASNILLQDRLATPRSFEPARFGAANSNDQNDYQQTLVRLNAEFRQAWEKQQLTDAPRADDLTLARRLSLGLTGSIPSLEEIRALEQVAPDD